MDVIARQPTELSTDLNVIEAEINAYQRVAGEAIFEIGKRLKHVKENDLTHGEFMNWYKTLGMNKDFVSTAIRAVEEIEESNFGTYRNLGIKALSIVLSLPKEQRESKHEVVEIKEINKKKIAVPTGKFKFAKDMTVKELRNVKKVLEGKIEVLTNENKALVADKKTLISENDRLEEQVDELMDDNYILKDKLDNVKPEVKIVEKVVEVKEVVEVESDIAKEMYDNYKTLSEELEYAQKELEKYREFYAEQSKEAESFKNKLIEIIVDGTNEITKTLSLLNIIDSYSSDVKEIKDTVLIEKWNIFVDKTKELESFLTK